MDLDPSKHGFLFCKCCLLLFFVTIMVVGGQQEYIANHQLACYDSTYNSVTKGFLCNGLQSSCQAYLTFRSTSTYYSPATISYLIEGGGQQTTASLIASINNISSDVSSIPDDTLVLIPVSNCSCYGSEYYQHNATYRLKFANETYFSVANDTYQGLTTCQAMMDQNPYGDRNLTVGLNLEAPLRCACPTSNQTDLGVKYLLTYMVTWNDSPDSIAEMFGVDKDRLLDANKLSSDSVIYPFTPLLVPLTAEPSIREATASPPPAPSPQIDVVPATNGSSGNKKWVYIGVGIGAALLVVVIAVFGVLLLRKRKKSRDESMPVKTPPGPKVVQSGTASDVYTALADKKSKSSSWSLSSHGIRYAIESLTLYKFEELQLATSDFDEANRIKGSVYKGLFKGDAAAVKVMKGDVLSEINILKRINHSNIIRLSGFCLHDGNTYLVYEYAENGSLSNLLHSSDKEQTLSWKQRVQIAHDVSDALNYLHNYTNPPHIHKNLKCSNILLDADMRAKVTNFGLSRALENDEDGGLQMTRHVVGTQGYMAPEYVENGVITPKLDVFAFGVMILELLSGKEASSSDKNDVRDVLLHSQISEVLEGENVRQKLRDFMDPSLKDEYPLDLAFSLAQLGKRCVASNLNARPSMVEVFMILSKICSSLLDWDPSDETERSTSLSHGR